MQYLVSIEDTTYHWWQLDLLIESFKMLGMEDDLLVAVAQNDAPKHLPFNKNISQHKRSFVHENFGRQRNYLPLNRNYAAFLAVNNGLIKQPFCLIDPDMVLVNPIRRNDERIGFQLRWLFSKELVEENGVNVSPLIEEILKARDIPDQSLWFPLGSVMAFFDAPEDIFSRSILWTEKLEYERQKRLRKEKKDYSAWWDTAKAGWVMALIEYYGLVAYRGHNDYEMTLQDNGLSHSFLHYKHGLPPYWSKYMYKYEPPDHFSMGGDGPFDTLLQHNPTTSTAYLQKVVRSYLGKDKA